MADRIDITLPESSQEGTESVIASWLKNEGERVELHEPIIEISTDKVNVEVPAPADGILVEILKHENEQVEIGDVLGRIEMVEDKPEETQTSAGEPDKKAKFAEAVESEPVIESQEARLSPSVRRLVKQHGIKISEIRGTGKRGRITFEDVENYLKSLDEGRAKEKIKDKISDRKIPHTPMRLGIAHHMVESKLKTAPHVTAVFDTDMSAVIKHRENNKEDFQRMGVKLTFTAYFVQAVVQALQTVPEVNSRWHDDALELFGDCNIGVATALDGGLIVPVLHKAQNLDLFATAEKLQDLTNRARNNKLEQHEVHNGTFTITNHGVSGSLIATPIINQPQSAILGIGKLEKRVVVKEMDGNDSIQIKPMIYVTVTIDHRALDGFQANTFLSKFVEVLENWL